MAPYSALRLLASVIFAIGATAQRHPLTDVPPSAPGIEHKEWFPEHFSLQFPAGKQIEVVAGLNNLGEESYNVTAIYGSLNAAHDFSLFFQNFTGLPYYDVLAPGGQVSLAYYFITAPNLPPRDFQVALTAFYNTETQGFATTFFNKTITIVEQPRFIDFELIFLWLLMLGLLGGGGYLLYNYLSSIGWIKKARKGKGKKIEPRNEDSSEWLKGTHYGTTKPSRKGSKELKKAAETKTS